MRALLRLVLVAALLLGAAAAAIAASGARDRSDASVRVAATGAVRLTNSRAGKAIIDAGGLRPGSRTDGTVRIGNDGDAPAVVRLSAAMISENPGPYGGRLSQALQLRLEDVTARARPAVVYEGSLGALPGTSLGRFAAGRTRTYRFTVTFPDAGTPRSPDSGDNAYQGSSLGVRYSWTADTDFSEGSRNAPDVALMTAGIGSRGRLLRDGVRVQVRCPAECFVLSRLLMARASAQRLGIFTATARAASADPTPHHVEIGRATLHLRRAGRAVLSVRLRRDVRRRLRRVPRFRVVLRTELRDADGRLQRTLSRALTYRADAAGRVPSPGGTPAPGIPAAPVGVPRGGATEPPAAAAPSPSIHSPRDPAATPPATTRDAGATPWWPWAAGAAVLAAIGALLRRRRRR